MNHSNLFASSLSQFHHS